MAVFSRKNGTLAALSLSALLIVGAYIFSTPGLAFFSVNNVNAQSTQDLLKAYAQKDSDGDGLPDWEEALYGTDPNNAHSISPIYTDGQAVAMGLIKPRFSVQGSSVSASSTDVSNLPGTTPAAGSMTDQFAQNIFSQYISQSDGTDPTPDQISALAQSAIQNVVQQRSTQDAYVLSQEKIQGTGPDALKTYASAAQDAVSNKTPSTLKNEIDFFSDAMATTSNQTDIDHLKMIGNSLTQTAARLISVPVPTEAQSAQLALSNSFAHLGQDVTDMSYLNTDPLRAYLGLSSYQQDSMPMLQALSQMSGVFDSEQVSLAENDPGYAFFHIVKKGAEGFTSATPAAANNIQQP
jgi:hypothetical protein